MLGTYLQKLKTDRSGSALAFTLLVTAVMFILAAAIMSVAGTDSDVGLAAEKSKIARYAAEGMVELVRADLQKALDDGGLPPEGEQSIERDIGGIPARGVYTVTVDEEDANRYTVELECTVTVEKGIFADTATKDLTVVLEYTPGLPPGGGGGSTPPPEDQTGGGAEPEEPSAEPVAGYNMMTALDYAITGGEDLHLTGDLLTVNGPIFSNGSVQLRPGIRITGPVKAAGTVSGSRADFPGVEMFSDQLPVTIPVADWVYIEQNATATYEGDTSINGGAQVHDGAIILVKGNLQLTGEISGDALIAATGNVIVFGDFGYPSTDNRAVGIVAGGNINLVSTAENQDDDGIQGPRVRGIVMAGGDIITQGESAVTGNLIAGGQVQSGNEVLLVNYIDGQDLMETGNPVYEVINKFGTGIIKNYGHLHLYIPDSAVGDGGAGGSAGTTQPGSGSDVDDSSDGSGAEGNEEALPSLMRIVSWRENN